jgi:hypothetical protein
VSEPGDLHGVAPSGFLSARPVIALTPSIMDEAQRAPSRIMLSATHSRVSWSTSRVGRTGLPLERLLDPPPRSACAACSATNRICREVRVTHLSAPGIIG